MNRRRQLPVLVQATLLSGCVSSSSWFLFFLSCTQSTLCILCLLGLGWGEVGWGFFSSLISLLNWIKKATVINAQGGRRVGGRTHSRREGPGTVHGMLPKSNAKSCLLHMWQRLPRTRARTRARPRPRPALPWSTPSAVQRFISWENLGHHPKETPRLTVRKQLTKKHTHTRENKKKKKEKENKKENNKSKKQQQGRTHTHTHAHGGRTRTRGIKN